MVKLTTSLLALTLATSSAIAISDKGHRSESDVSNQIHLHALEHGQERAVPHFPHLPHRHLRYGFALAPHHHNYPRELEDDEDLFGRDTSDDLEAREPISFGSVSTIPRIDRVSGRVRHPLGRPVFLERGGPGHRRIRRLGKFVNKGMDVGSALQSRDFEEDEEVFGRDLDASDDLEAREPFGFGAIFKAAHSIEKIARKNKGGIKKATHSAQRFTQKHQKGINRAKKGARYTGKAANGVNNGMQIYQTIRSRDLENDEELFGRDFEAEELAEREYDLFDERDIFDDLD